MTAGLGAATAQKGECRWRCLANVRPLRDTKMISLRKLELFAQVARVGSITMVARELGISQPAVSAQIRELERVFDAELLYRDGKRMRLSEAGEIVYRYATTMGVATQDAIDQVHSLEAAESGSVAVGATQSPGKYMLPEILVRFKVMHPASHLTLLVSGAEDIWEKIRHGQLDMGVVAGPEPPRDLNVAAFCEEELIIICAADSTLAGATVSRTRLEDVPVISGTRRIWIEDRHRAFGLDQANIVIHMGDDEGIKCAVRSGLGVAMMYRCAVMGDIREGKLAEVMVDGVKETRSFYRLVSPYKHLSPIQRRFFDDMATWHNGNES